MRLKFIFFSLLIFFYSSTKGQTTGKNGMVVSDNKIASEIGINILKKGGNAIDAAIATAFALAVTHPQAGNIGGGGFMIYLDKNGDVTTIDFREKAPLAATETMFQDKNGNLIKGSNHNGLKSVGVPGTVAGLFYAHKKYGNLTWEKLVQPSIDLAIEGFPMTWALYDWALEIEKWDKPMDILRDYFKNENKEIVKPGELWRQPALGNTLKQIKDGGKDAFYKGNIAKEIAAYMKLKGGLITLKDLRKYKPIERKPIVGTYKSFQIYSMPPPSSGGVALIEMMNMMELLNLDSIKFNTTLYFHLLAESMRRAFAHRAEFLGDPDFNLNIPTDSLTSKEFAKIQVAGINLTKASQSDSTKFGQIYDGSSTTHFSVVDKNGGAVSLTYTLEQSYGSGMGSSKLGFIFNNEMGDFNPVKGETNSRGQIGTTPNLIQPGKRMLSSMTPTIVVKNNKPFLIIGSPGGRTIINTVFQTTLGVLEYNMSVKNAIEGIKIHHGWLPDKIKYEKDLLSPDLVKSLEKMGHQLEETEKLGRLMGIKYNHTLQRYEGASDSSSPDGAAIGY